MTRTARPAVVALLLAATALLTTSCSSSQSGGDANPDNQFQRNPGASATPSP